MWGRRSILSRRWYAARCRCRSPIAVTSPLPDCPGTRRPCPDRVDLATWDTLASTGFRSSRRCPTGRLFWLALLKQRATVAMSAGRSKGEYQLSEISIKEACFWSGRSKDLGNTVACARMSMHVIFAMDNVRSGRPIGRAAFASRRGNARSCSPSHKIVAICLERSSRREARI